MNMPTIRDKVGLGTMKALAILGGAGAVTAAVTGGPAAMVIGNLAALSVAAALFLSTIDLRRVG